MSCYACKTHLYTALKDIHQHTLLRSTTDQVILFNGTNKDDLVDETRVGLVAAKEFKVMSPLEIFTKDSVREIAYELGLPNHSHAASPCLRSRLALGVRATDENLYRIEEAEIIVKRLLQPSFRTNLRVRHLPDNGARIDLDSDVLDDAKYSLHLVAEAVSALGFKYVRFHPFKSGSMSKPFKI